MKNVITGIDYIPAKKVMAWLDEARSALADSEFCMNERLDIAHSFTRDGYKVSWVPVRECLNRIANYPHTSFQKRPELIKLVHRITKIVDSHVEYEANKTVEVIRKSDGKHIMADAEMAKYVVEEAKVATYA